MNISLRLLLTLALGLFLTVPQHAAYADDDDETSASEDSGSGRKIAKGEDDEDSDDAAETTSNDDSSSKDEEVASNDDNGNADEDKNERAEEIFQRTKNLVKRLDAMRNDGKKYPSPVVESAVRKEFFRLSEGKRDLGWLRGKKLVGGNRDIAQDNFNLFLAYAEKLAAAGKTAKAKTKGTKDETTLLAAKAIIDRFSTKQGAKTLVTLIETPDGLSGIGRKEAKRRDALLGNLAPGGYQPMNFKNIDDANKAYRARLVTSVKEFETLAKLLGGSKTAPAGERAVASEGGKKKNKKSKDKKDGKKKKKSRQ